MIFYLIWTCRYGDGFPLSKKTYITLNHSLVRFVSIRRYLLRLAEMVHGVPVLLEVEKHVTLEQKRFNVPGVQQTGLVREVNCAFVVFVLMTVVTDRYPGFGPLFTTNYKKSQAKMIFCFEDNRK